jgi:hypothetical protein
MNKQSIESYTAHDNQSYTCNIRNEENYKATWRAKLLI